MVSIERDSPALGGDGVQQGGAVGARAGVDLGAGLEKGRHDLCAPVVDRGVERGRADVVSSVGIGAHSKQKRDGGEGFAPRSQVERSVPASVARVEVLALCKTCFEVRWHRQRDERGRVPVRAGRGVGDAAALVSRQRVGARAEQRLDYGRIRVVPCRMQRRFLVSVPRVHVRPGGNQGLDDAGNRVRGCSRVQWCVAVRA